MDSSPSQCEKENLIVLEKNVIVKVEKDFLSMMSKAESIKEKYELQIRLTFQGNKPTIIHKSSID